MRMLRLLVLGVLLSLPGRLAPVASAAQEPGDDVTFSPAASFEIPVTITRNKHRLRQLRLFVSTDKGKTWQQAASIRPTATAFHFDAEHDGLYWFTVQTEELTGRLYPPSLERANLRVRKVWVDTHPPVVELRPLPPHRGEVGVTWTVTDNTPDTRAGALRLAYRAPGATSWQPVDVEPTATEAYFDPRTTGKVEVRLQVRDRAENWAEKRITLAGAGRGGGSGSEEAPVKKPAPVTPRPRAHVRMVKSKHFTLSYDVKETGPSDVSTVDLWYTQDGGNWLRNHTQKCKKSADDRPPYTIDVNVKEEGLWGFTLVVHSGVGLSERPPQVGDEPQIWVEVDLTRPQVQITEVVVGRGPDKGKLKITWTATDRNMADKPITLSYSAKPAGPWVSIVEKLANTGQYVWVMPAAEKMPYEFYLQAEAVDKAGNVGAAVTREKVKVDLSQPKVKIIEVKPLEKAAPRGEDPATKDQ
jgi:hypothetical protein